LFLFLFLQDRGSVCPGGYAGLFQGWLAEYHVTLGGSPVGLLNVSQVGLEPVSGSVGALLFSQCNVAWRSFPKAMGSGCQSFDSSLCFISYKCGSSISARFLIYGAHAVCFCALVTIFTKISYFNSLVFFFKFTYYLLAFYYER
jgi:hypothetical protein